MTAPTPVPIPDGARWTTVGAAKACGWNIATTVGAVPLFRTPDEHDYDDRLCLARPRKVPVEVGQWRQEAPSLVPRRVSEIADGEALTWFRGNPHQTLYSDWTPLAVVESWPLCPEPPV